MIINKRVCRKYKDPGLTIPVSNGLLYAKQIRYIVRTAIKNIGGSRLLVLYLYNREHAAEQDFRPVYTLFQGKDDFATLAQGDNGLLKWSTASLDNINREYNFDSQCAFYSSGDEERVIRYCKSNGKTGFSALSTLQYEIKAAHELAQRHRKQKPILKKMQKLGSLPRDFKGWIHREVMPAYVFYDYKKGKRFMSGYCTACRHVVEVETPKHNTQGVCPYCKREIILKSRGKRGWFCDRATAQFVEKISQNELAIRIFKVYYTYQKQDVPVVGMYETIRHLVHHNENGECVSHPYYHCHNSGDITPWKHGTPPVRSYYQENFHAETCAHLYHRNLENALEGTDWRYCQIKMFYLQDKKQMEAAPYFKAYSKYPQIEMLLKMGLYQFTTSLIYSDAPYKIDATKKKPHQVFLVQPEEWRFLLRKGLEIGELAIMQKLNAFSMSTKLRMEIFVWIKRHIIGEYNIITALKKVPASKLIGYINKQFTLLHPQRTQNGRTRFNSMNDVLQEYNDYLSMCEKEGLDICSNKILFPQNVKVAHDRLSRRIKIRKNEEHRRKFAEVVELLAHKFDFAHEGLQIIQPSCMDDIINEGNALNHCVGSYVESMANGKCIILFIRRSDTLQKPFYTMELRDNKVSQVRGEDNGGATPEVNQIVSLWEKKVLQTVKLPAAA